MYILWGFVVLKWDILLVVDFPLTSISKSKHMFVLTKLWIEIMSWKLLWYSLKSSENS